MRIVKSFSALTLSLVIFLFLLFLPKNALAIQEGHVKCGTGTNCENPTYPTCQEGCAENQTDCGFNCPSGGGGTCFPAGTKVTLSGGSTKNIEDIQPGDKVLSENENGKQSVSTVKQLLSPISNNMCTIRYTNGESLDVTKGHPLFTQNGWKAIDTNETMKEDPGVPVSTLNVGDFMKKDTGTWDQISNISCKDETVQTYNLSVDNAHTYFAGGFLAHNKGQQCISCQNDGAGAMPVYILSIQPTSSSFTVNWIQDGSNANVACGDFANYNNHWHNIVYVGTDYNAVNSFCGGAVGTYQYRGEDSFLPYGCTASWETNLTNSLNSATANPPVTINAGTTYYVKVALRLDYSNDNSQTYTNTFCGDQNKGFLGSCGIVPPSATIGVGATQSFTTAANGPGTIDLYPTSYASAYYVPPSNYQCNSDGCWFANSGYYHIDGNLGSTGSSGYASDRPNVKIIHNGQVAYDAQHGLNTDGTISIMDNEFFIFYTGTSAGDTVTVSYPPPPAPAVASAQWVTHQVCSRDPETNKLNCVTVIDGVNIAGSHFGTGPDTVTLHQQWPGHFIATLTGTYNTTNDSNIFVPNSDLSAAGFNQQYWTPVTAKVAYTAGTVQPNASLNPANQVDHVNYSESAPAGYISIAPTSSTDKANAWPTLATGVQATNPITSIINQVYTSYLGSYYVCSAQAQITVQGNVDPWWQVKDGDVQTNGDLTSKVPGSNMFDLPGAGTYAGIPAYGGTTGLTTANVSAQGWLANSPWSSPKVFNYAYFANQIPSGTNINSITTIDQATIDAGTVDTATGYYWYKYNGAAGQPLTVGGPVVIGAKKIILLVANADLNINANINGRTVGSGFFMAIVNGNIVVSPNVGGATPNLVGLYLADGTFSDGTLNPSPDNQLLVRGSVVAYGGVSLQRDLGDANNTTPAEIFEYLPDQILLFPKVLGVRKINWKEVAP